MDSTLFIVGVIGNIVSVLVFVSPIKTFCRIVKGGSTEEFEPSPYVFTLLNALLWLYYGLTKPDGFLVATVNGFGAVMEVIYVILFIVYAVDHDTRIRTARLAAAVDIASFGVVFLITTFAISELSLRIMVIGMICMCLNIVMYGSPLAATIPNGIGFVLGTIQLIIYAIYKIRASQSSNEITDDTSQASAPLVLSDTV
ncbi:hypothetical protein EJB05_30781, partial [Eragrostis curvula]